MDRFSERQYFLDTFSTDITASEDILDALGDSGFGEMEDDQIDDK